MQRRHFLSTSAALAATSAVGLPRASAKLSQDGGLIEKGDVVLFQGDSITDAGRSREKAGEPNVREALGNGYAWLAASQLLVDRPDDELQIFNRGISGHKVPQLADRWDRDCFDLKPDVLSILIGVNDIWHGLNGRYDGTPESYEKGYLALVERTLDELPDLRLIVCEPFVLRCGAVDDKWFPEFDAYRASAKKVADAFAATFVPFQSMFDEAAKIAPAEHWAGDGVHPSASGAALMAHTWRRAAGW
jgi:lysophospholipase L1-like esterase